MPVFLAVVKEYKIRKVLSSMDFEKSKTLF